MNLVMGYAFISYSSKNQQMADSFRTLFNQNGIGTWMAPGDIPFGSTYTSTINRAIKEASCFVLLLSESAQSSKWVPNETERAVSYGKTIFTILLDDVPMNDDFEFMLSTSQAVAIRKIDDSDEKIKQLVVAIKTYSGKEFDADYENAIGKKDRSPQTKAKNIDFTIWSPVNTDVFLNDKNHLVMRIGHNSGFDYKFNSINVCMPRKSLT